MPSNKMEKKLWLAAALALGAAFLLAISLVTAQQPEASGPACSSDGATLQLECPSLPDTTADGNFNDGLLDWDVFAWNSFIAMNWPALDPSENNNQRGFPDLSTSFRGAESSDLAVWETYKEKREVFLANPFTGDPVTNPQPQPWNSEPVYGPSDAQVPCCPGADCTSPFERHVAFNTGDETAEVASEARETNAVLCQGHSSDCGVQGQKVGPRVWRGQPSQNMPLIYEVKVNWDFYNYVGTFSDPGPLWVEGNAVQAAANGDIRLPARTSGPKAPNMPGTGFSAQKAGAKPGDEGPNPIVTNYSAEDCLTDYYQKVTPTSSLTPCPMGSLHLKAAWMPLSDDEYSSGDYHTTELLYYVSNSDVQGGICKMPGKYGLVGLHIIQRVHAWDPGLTQSYPHGGTFIFASWEHTDNDHQGFTYANLYPVTSDEPQPYPNVEQPGVDAIPLNRAYEILDSTAKANQAVHEALGCTGGSGDSVWCNYELIGTQYTAVSGPPSGFDTSNPPTTLPSTPQPGIELPANSGQPYFLANLVVESNVGLQQFLGLPPETTPIDHYAKPKPPPGTSGRTGNDGVNPNTASSFDLTADNLAFRIAPRSAPAYNSDTTTRSQNQKVIHSRSGDKDDTKQGAYNMGGCMGCHGVAQLNGYSFSFVLLDNQTGGAPDTQEKVEIPPPAPPTSK